MKKEGENDCGRKNKRERWEGRGRMSTKKEK